MMIIIVIEPSLPINYLDSFCKDIAGLGQEQGGHGLLVGKRGVEVVEHLVEDCIRMIIFILFDDDDYDDDDSVPLVYRKDFSCHIVW